MVSHANLHTVGSVPPLRLSFAQPFIDVPREVGAELLRRMREIMESLEAVPRSSTFWKSLSESWLVIRVGEWRFQYRLDVPENRIQVVAAARREPGTAA